MAPSPRLDPSTGRLAVIGSINIDRSITLDRFPRPGETLSATSLSTSVGGKGANQATAASYAGANVAMVGSVGDDREGDAACATLRAAGVDTTGVRVTATAPTGTAWITVASEDNTVVIVPGANHEWPEGLSHAEPGDVVLCQLEIPLSVVRETASMCHGTFVLNAAPSRSLDDQLLSECDVLIVNEHELAEVSGSHVDARSLSSVTHAARSLIARGVPTVVTTLGGAGAVLCNADGNLLATTPPTPTIVDTTGAGDAFCGVFAAQLSRGASRSDALRRAVAAGSLAVRHATAQGGYAAFADLGDVLAETPGVTTIPQR